MEYILKFEELTKFFRNADITDVKTFEGSTSLRRFIASMLSYYPWWIILLYRIRKLLVAVLGLVKHEEPNELPNLRPEDVSFTAGENVTFFVVRCAEEERFWVSETPDDKHLKAYFGVVKESISDSVNRFYVITTVYYKHWTGPVYFNLIRPFHHLVVARMARYALADPMKMSNLAFKMMSNFGMPIRNLFMPPAKMLAEAAIRLGDKVLDFGCGPGEFSLMIAEAIGPSGRVYALDIHPLAIRSVEQKALRRKLSNVKTVLSSCNTALPDKSLDRVIFFDVFHDLDNQKEVLVELHRILKPGAAMCFSDHHMKEEVILKSLTERGLFKLKSKGKRTFTFGKLP